MEIKSAALFLLFAYVALGGVAFVQWDRRRQRPDRQADFRTRVAYWLPKLIVAELYTLAGGVGWYVVLAFVQPTLHGADESYFVLGGSLALATFVVVCAVYDALVVARCSACAQRRQAPVESPPQEQEADAQPRDAG